MPGPERPPLAAREPISGGSRLLGCRVLEEAANMAACRPGSYFGEEKRQRRDGKRLGGEGKYWNCDGSLRVDYQEG